MRVIGPRVGIPRQGVFDTESGDEVGAISTIHASAMLDEAGQ